MGPRRKTKVASFSSGAAAATAAERACITWFETRFGCPWATSGARFGATTLRERFSIDSDGERAAQRARLIFDQALGHYSAIAKAVAEATAWAAGLKPDALCGDDVVRGDDLHGLAGLLRREVPELARWAERHSTIGLAGRGHRPLVGLERFVHMFDRYNYLQLRGRPDGSSQFMTVTELAKLSIACGFGPETGYGNSRDLTVSSYIATQAAAVKAARRRVGALTTAEAEQRMGVAGKRGPRTKDPKRPA